MARSKKESIVKGSGNIFADLGFANPEEHQLKARLVSRLDRIRVQEGLTQNELAEQLGITQGKVSEMLRGRFRGFSVYRLMCFLSLMGEDVEIVTGNASQPRKRDRLEIHASA